MMPCGATGASTTYCLDDCNGYEGELSGTDDFKYRYYLSGVVGDLSCSATVTNSKDGDCTGDCCVNEIPDTTYHPYTIGCYKGCLWNAQNKGECTGEAGFVSAS